MAHIEKFNAGELIAIREGSSYYYYLLLSEPVYFNCQWAYAFHKKSESLLSRKLILEAYGSGFDALIDFTKKVDIKSIHRINREVDIAPYQVRMNSKVRIDKPEGGHEWYIFNPKFQILKKQKKLKNTQIKFPVASGITCADARQLIDRKWETHQIVEEEGRGQFPI